MEQVSPYSPTQSHRPLDCGWTGSGPVNYKLALAKSICQRLNNSYQDICHLPLQRLKPVPLQLLTFNKHPPRGFRAEAGHSVLQGN